MFDINWSTVIAILVITTIIEFISIVIRKSIEEKETKESIGRLDLCTAESIVPIDTSVLDCKLRYLDTLIERERLYVNDTLDSDELGSIKERINVVCDDIESDTNVPCFLQLAEGGIVTGPSFFGSIDNPEKTAELIKQQMFESMNKSKGSRS